jgi:hypothetical protein
MQADISEGDDISERGAEPGHPIDVIQELNRRFGLRAEIFPPDSRYFVEYFDGDDAPRIAEGFVNDENKLDGDLYYYDFESGIMLITPIQNGETNSDLPTIEFTEDQLDDIRRHRNMESPDNYLFALKYDARKENWKYMTALEHPEATTDEEISALWRNANEACTLYNRVRREQLDSGGSAAAGSEPLDCAQLDSGESAGVGSAPLDSGGSAGAGTFPSVGHGVAKEQSALVGGKRRTKKRQYTKRKRHSTRRCRKKVHNKASQKRRRKRRTSHMN